MKKKQRERDSLFLPLFSVTMLHQKKEYDLTFKNAAIKKKKKIEKLKFDCALLKNLKIEKKKKEKRIGDWKLAIFQTLGLETLGEEKLILSLLNSL